MSKVPGGNVALPEETRRQLARKLKALMFLNLHSTQSLAIAARLAAGSGMGVLMLDDLEKMARVLGVKEVECSSRRGGGGGAVDRCYRPRTSAARPARCRSQLMD